jgi:hypothetical protein
LERVPFLRLESLDRRAPLAASFSGRPGWLAQVRAGTRHCALVVEGRRFGHPREVRAAILQLERYLADLGGNKQGYGVLLAPFISAESARLCTEAGIGYADLAGNARLSFDQVFIETRAADNPFREKREIQSLFAPKAARVLRVLLQGPPRAWKVTDLASTAHVSLGWVSAVRQQLLAREWAAEVEGGLRVAKPDALLDAWAEADDWGKRTAIQEYSALDAGDPVRLARKVQKVLAEEGPLFTQWLAGWLRHPYTTPPAVTAYVRRFPDESRIEKQLLARRVDGAGGLRLVVPKDEGVLYSPQKAQGLDLVSDVQIYLDLLATGQRGEEQAAELRKWPDFAGGWA